MKYLSIIFLTITLLIACKSESEKKESTLTNVLKVKDLKRATTTKLNPNNTNETYLTLVDNNKTGIDFVNTIKETEFKNHKSYPQIYNGGGVALGDLNNDGLPDIYLAGNGSKDKIYFNIGDFKFKDVTEESGISKENYGWSFGVNMVDINADGFLDIYVCKAGPYSEEKYLRNRLFINNGDGPLKRKQKNMD